MSFCCRITLACCILAMAAAQAQEAEVSVVIEEAEEAVQHTTTPARAPVDTLLPTEHEIDVEALVTLREEELPENAVILELHQAQAQAMRDNPTLHAAEARIAQAQQRIRQVQALYYPTLDASYSASHTELPRATVRAQRQAINDVIRESVQRTAAGVAQGQPLTTNQLLGMLRTFNEGARARGAVPTSVDTYRASLEAGYLVFDGFARRFARAIAVYGHQQTEAAYAETQRLLLAAVAQAFYGAQLARENLAIARADEAFNLRLLRDAEARRRVGTGPLSDVLNFEVRVRAARAAILQSQNQYEQARIALAALMGLQDARLEENVVVGELQIEEPEELSRPDEEELVEFALAFRPDLERSMLEVQQAQAVIGQRRAAYFPRVFASASKDAVVQGNTRFDRDDFSSTISLNISQNLYAGGRRRAEVAEARHLRTEAQHLLTQAELDVVREVRQAVEDVRTAQEQLVLQRTTAEYVERNRDLVERELRAGTAAVTRLNEAQRDLIEAQARLALARVTLRLAWHDVEVVTARILNSFDVPEDQAEE